MDGVWLAPLAAVTDPSLVAQALADTLSIREAPGQPILDTLLAMLKDKQMLLVLDNCEHLLDASASLVDAVILYCPKVNVPATSREALGITGETSYRVPSLPVPEPNKDYTPESLVEFEAIRLFAERALGVKTDFALTTTHSTAVVSICRRLDGIPLAIELAAARVGAMPVEEINERLDNCFRLLTGGSRTALPRQQTLRSLIDWSYDLLTEPEKVLLCRLSVFYGGFSLSAVEQVCAADEVVELEVLDLLTALGVAIALSNLGTISQTLNNYVAVFQGNLPLAKELFEEGLTISREVGNSSGIAYSLFMLADVLSKQGDTNSASAHYAESLFLSNQVGNKINTAKCLEAFAGLSSDRGNTRTSAALWGAADTLRESCNAPRQPNEQDEYKDDVVAARQALGEDAFDASWTQGRVMSLEEAIDLAMAEPDA